MSGKGSVLVTGGAKRIGKVICDVLRERGWNVLVHSRDPENPLCADFSEYRADESLFRRALAIAPDLCAIVNNASQFSTAAEMPGPDELRLLQINTLAPVHLAKYLYCHLHEAGKYGAVVNIVDSRILDGNADTPYERTKLKLFDISQGDAALYAPTLRVNMVAPGPVLAPADKANSEPGGNVLLDQRPDPQDVAEAVAYLLEAKSVTGQTIAVDSGQSLITEDSGLLF